MTSNPKKNCEWLDVAMRLAQIEEFDYPEPLFSELRIMDAPSDGSPGFWNRICAQHNEEVLAAVRQWSLTGRIEPSNAKVTLLLRIRAATARSHVSNLFRSHTTLPTILFPFPSATVEQVAALLLTEWWDDCGAEIAGRSYQSWAKSHPQ